ncbi:hypothetical protein FACS1894139_15620 [Planctomycetales bacterium]|nr:hypothetical protein FACS1894108_11530 [Planctomycetales bacterium]GHT07383.1 hypothetical protein FACS1894139_15620 [Planctomycetales bacterium]
MTSAELSKKIAAELGELASPQTVLTLAGELVKDALFAGDSADLFNLLRVKVGGNTADDDAEKDAIKITPLPDLLLARHRRRKAVSGEEQLPIAFAVDKVTAFAKIFERRLRGDGREVATVVGVEGLTQELDRHPLAAVVVEAANPDLPALRQWLKIDRTRNAIALIVIYQTDEKPAYDGLLIAADATLTEPFDDRQLNETIDGEITRVRGEHRYFLQTVSMTLPPPFVNQQVAADLIEELARQATLSEEGTLSVVMAFREALDNSARHGCRDIPNALLKVDYVLDSQKITITIKDPGPGFDSANLLNTRFSADAVTLSRQRTREGKRGGLGMTLMLKSLDKLEYSPSGNTVILTKFLKPQNKS